MESNNRNQLISEILQNCGYMNVRTGDDAWNMVGLKLDSVVRRFASQGLFANLYRKNVKVYQELNPDVISEFNYFDKVYILPADCYRIENTAPNLKVLLSKKTNIYYLCYKYIDGTQPFNELISYSISPSFEDFSWCENSILEEIKAETVSFIIATRMGQDLAYHANSQKELKATRRTRIERNGGISFKGF